MINPVQQSYIGSTSLNASKTDRENRANETQKMENNRAAKIAEQIKNGVYKIDTRATAKAMMDWL